MIDFSLAIGSVGGNDFSGEIIAVGSAVARRRPGDSVCGFLYGLDPHLGEGEWAGAFAEYVSLDEGLVMSISPGIGMAEYACLRAGVIMAGISLFRSLGLKEITESKEDSKKERQYLLIYGRSTATGTMAIQLVKAAGYIPITTCSPSNFALVQSFGGAKAFDYHSPSCRVSIRAYTKGKLQHTLDCVTDSQSIRVCYVALGTKGGKYTALEPPARQAKGRKELQSDWVMALTIFGKAVDLKDPFGRDAAPEDMDWVKSWYRKAEELVAGGTIRPHPAKEMPGGWPEVLEGIDLLRNGKFRGQKLFYRVWA